MSSSPKKPDSSTSVVLSPAHIQPSEDYPQEQVQNPWTHPSYLALSLIDQAWLKAYLTDPARNASAAMRACPHSQTKWPRTRGAQVKRKLATVIEELDPILDRWSRAEIKAAALDAPLPSVVVKPWKRREFTAWVQAVAMGLDPSLPDGGRGSPLSRPDWNHRMKAKELLAKLKGWSSEKHVLANDKKNPIGASLGISALALREIEQEILNEERAAGALPAQKEVN